MEPATRRTLETIAGQLAVIVGVVHLGLGAYYTIGGPGEMVASDPRMLLWAVTGATLVGGVSVAAVGTLRRQLYVPGLVITGGLLAAHFLWPVVVGGSFYLGPVDGGSLPGVLGYVHAQVTGARPVAQIALATELALLAILAVLRSSKEL